MQSKVINVKVINVYPVQSSLFRSGNVAHAYTQAQRIDNNT